MMAATNHDIGTARSVADDVATLQSTATAASRRVCWVTEEIVGLFRNGGAGTAVSGFCEAAVAAGHEVTVLYMGHVDRSAPKVSDEVARLERTGHRIVFLGDVAGLQSVEAGFASRSFIADRWLRDQNFDIVHFHDFNGYGHYACLAKRQGLAYARTLLCVTIFGSTRWAWECMEMFVRDVGDLERDYLERKSTENADYVLCHSRYMAGWLRRNGVAIEKGRTLVQPSIMPRVNIPKAIPRSVAHTTPITEIIFFGRQEVRKGLRVFVQAAEILAGRFPHLKFTVLGKFSSVDYEHSGAYILSRLAQIPNDITFIADFDRDEAIRYLKRPECLAVMPSSDDNFPGTVFEAVLEGLEFLTTDRGGIPEIVHPDCHSERLFTFSGPSLAEAVTRTMERRPAPARLAFDQDANTSAWMDWHALAPGQQAAGLRTTHPAPRVTICIVHYNRPHLLAQAIAGVEAQTYDNFEVVLVDDGSPSREAQDYVAAVEARTWRFPFRVVRTNDIGLAAARNAGADAAAGDYIVFVDDDNVPMPVMVETMVRAATARDLDVGTALSHLIGDESEPVRHAEPGMCAFFPPGGPLSAGLINNVFGDANAIIKLASFRAVGGFEPTRGIGAEDWDLFARLALQGYRLEVVPEPIYWYRLHRGQLTSRPHSRHAYFERILTTYRTFAQDATQGEVSDTYRIYQGLFVDRKLANEAAWHVPRRPHGQLQMELAGCVNDVEQSYRLLYTYALRLGRLRDAARLSMRRDQPATHLAALETDLARFYRESTRPVQVAFGEDDLPAPRRHAVMLTPAVLAQTRYLTDLGEGQTWSPLEVNRSGRYIGLHPLPGNRISAARLAGAVLGGATGAVARVLVANHQGPVVRFSMHAIESDAEWIEGEPLASLAEASIELGPSDGTRVLALDLPFASKTPLDLLIMTEGLETTDFAWARFTALGILFGELDPTAEARNTHPPEAKPPPPPAAPSPPVRVRSKSKWLRRLS